MNIVFANKMFARVYAALRLEIGSMNSGVRLFLIDVFILNPEVLDNETSHFLITGVGSDGLSVTKLHKNLSLGKMSGFRGFIPQVVNPSMIFIGVIDLTNASDHSARILKHLIIHRSILS